MANCTKMLLGEQDEDRELTIHFGKIQSLVISVTGHQWNGDWSALFTEKRSEVRKWGQ